MCVYAECRYAECCGTKTGHGRAPLFPTFSPPGACGGGWTQTLDLEMMRRVFYHYATAALFYYLSMHKSTKLSGKLQFPKACSIFSTIVFVCNAAIGKLNIDLL
jgi:hypothetical protein